MAGDIISKARSDTVAMEGVVAEIHRTTPVQELDDSSATAARETIPVDAATARIRTAVARVQAFARGVVARRSFRSEKGLESANMCSISPVVTCYTMADESPLVTTGAFSKADKSRTCGRKDREVTEDSPSNDSSRMWGQR